ncbi:MFS transporter [Telmatospirillum sp.]|uniref:MFS transporter n=1 Tax=Telmatospirillum sp. TaxID=2079197 RepID=UPI0028492E17|nr:MFS transporter [Telmatospirillum sp.]MDR3440309.1 MFS transporter [Telmatospirillum sp.]
MESTEALRLSEVLDPDIGAPAASRTTGGASPAMMRRLAGASMVGTTLEWYDFTVYNTMAALIFNKLFFPSFSPLAGVILAFSTYAVGYVSRPLGGVFFGHLGDKLGRRVVLVVTLIVMGLTTFLMGVLPTFDAVGIASPLLLVSLRFIQGVALGGEWAGSVLLSVEHGRQDRRGLNASWTQVGPSMGTLLATALITLVTMTLSDQDFVAWGWRIPFLVSAILVGFGLWVRIGVDETPMFKQIESAHKQAKAPVGEVLTKHLRSLIIAGGARVGSDVLFALVVVFTMTYVTQVLNLPRPVALTAVLIGAAFNVVCVPLFGRLSDSIGRRPVYAIGAVAGAVWAYVFFGLLDTANPYLIVLAVVAGLIFHAAMYGPQGAFVTEQFSTRVRYSGSSLAYTFAGVVGGGFAPLIIVTLYHAYSSTLAVSLYVMGALCVTGIALWAAKETAGRPLQD